MLLRTTVATAMATILLAAPVAAGPPPVECVIHDWAVPPGVWTGSGDTDPSPLLMTATTRWLFHLDNCSLTSGVCDVFGSGSRTFQNGAERPEWYPTNTQPTISAVGNDVTYAFAMRDAFVPIQGQPRFEDMDWSLTAQLPSAPPDSPSAADLAAATSLTVAIDHWVDNTFFTIHWGGTATETQFVSCTPVVASLSIDDVSQSEGSGGGTTAFVFTVTRDHNQDAVSVTAQTADGTAVAGADYAGVGPVVLSFPASGTLTQTVTVDVGADDLVELDEGYTVELSSEVNATIGDGTGAGSISNDDQAAISIDGGSQIEGSGGGAVPFVFSVSLDAAVDTLVEIDFDTADGTAEDEAGDGDYTAAQGTVQFTAGTAGDESVSIDVIADDRPETDETFFVDLSNLAAGGRDVIVATSSGGATILDDDDACPGFTVYRQPWDSPTSLRGHPATSGPDATFENVVDESGAPTPLPPGLVSALRAWGVGDDAGAPCTLDASEPFDLVFAADGGGAPGAVVAQMSGLLPVLTPAGGDAVQIDFVFAPFDADGVSWLSIQRAEIAGCAFEWLAEELTGTYDDMVFTPPAVAPDDAYVCLGDLLIFLDGFESGDTSAWSATVP